VVCAQCYRLGHDSGPSIGVGARQTVACARARWTDCQGVPSERVRLWRCPACGELEPRGCDSSGRSLSRARGEIAQLVEHTTENRGVLGSIPSLAILFLPLRSKVIIDE